MTDNVAHFPSSGALLDIDNPAPAPRCLVDEIITNRDAYISDDSSSTVGIYRFPLLLLEALSTIETILDERIGYNGVSLIAVIAMSEGHKVLVHDHNVRKLFELRRQYYALDRRPVDKYLKREVSGIFNSWSFYVKGDDYGGKRKNFYNVPKDIARGIHTTHERLGINKGEIASLCISKCLIEQELLSTGLRREIETLIEAFGPRLDYRVRVLGAVIDMITRTGTRKERLKRSRRRRRK